MAAAFLVRSCVGSLCTCIAGRASRAVLGPHSALNADAALSMRSTEAGACPAVLPVVEFGGGPAPVSLDRSATGGAMPAFVFQFGYESRSSGR